MSTTKPIDDIWGEEIDAKNGEGFYRCRNHPERIGFVDLGIDAPNRYPCRECYDLIVQDRPKK